MRASIAKRHHSVGSNGQSKCGCGFEFGTSPWQAVRMQRMASIQLKQEDELPVSIAYLADGTSQYESEIRAAWNAFKLDPTPAKAREFIDFLMMLSDSLWPEVMAAILGIDVDELSTAHLQVLEDALEEHHGYMEESLLPDVVRAIANDNLSSLDYRTIVLYAGALWQFGNLVTVMFDGLKFRDLADLFMFAGPDDSETCTGDNGCEQYANGIYTVAQILAEGIIPGRLRCLTNCRHFLLPIASPLKGGGVLEKHQPGQHDQGKHRPKKLSSGELTTTSAEEQAWVVSLTADEMEAVNGYMNIGPAWMGSAAINSSLRSGEIDERTSQQIGLLDSAIAKAPKTTRPTTFYRSEPSGAKAGGYVSAFKNPQEGLYTSGGRVQRAFTVPAGTPVAPLSSVHTPYSEEVLLPRDVELVEETFKHQMGRHDQSTHDPHKGKAGYEPWQMTLGEIEAIYPKAGETVDGRIVREHIPNQDSIDASIDSPTVLDGIYDVPLSEFDLTGKHYSVEGTKRIAELVGEIKESGEINPLIVVIDAEAQPYILEGATRAEALYKLGAKSLPAQIVIDEGFIYDRVEQAVAGGEQVPPEVIAEYPDLVVTMKHQPGQHDQKTHTPKKYGGGESPSIIPGMAKYNRLADDRQWVRHPIMDDSWKANSDIKSGIEAGARKGGKFGLCAYHSMEACADDPSLKVMVGIAMTDVDQKRLLEFDYDQYWEPRFLGTVHVWNEDANGRVVDHAIGSRGAKGSVYIGKAVPDDLLRGMENDGELLNYAHDIVNASRPASTMSEAEYREMWEEWRTQHKHQPGRHDQKLHAPEKYRGQGIVKPGPQVFVSERIQELMDPDSETNTQARENWKNLSHAERMKLLDPEAIDKGMESNLSIYREEYEKPHDLSGAKLTDKSYDQVAANANAHIDSLKGALSPTTEEQLRTYVDTHMRDAVQLGLKDKSVKLDAGQLDDMVRKSVDKMVHQEIESRKRQLGDHGIRHVVGNIRAAGDMLDDPDLPPTNGMQRMLAIQTMVDHDMGYTAGVVTKSLEATRYHQLYSEKYAKAQGYDKVFGEGNAKELQRMVREHSQTDLDWDKDTLMSAVRTADNTALFSREKLPALFHDVPGATDELYKLQLANAAGDAKATTPKVKANLHKLIDGSKIDERQKVELHQAADEVSPFTGKFTLGMAAGEIDGYDYKDKAMTIKVKGKPERELLAGLFDLGDRQFDKFAGDYDTVGGPSTGGMDMSKGGKKVLRIEYTEPTTKPSGTLATMHQDSIRPNIRSSHRQLGLSSSVADRARIWPAIEANIKGKLNAAELAEFERRFKADTLDEMPLTERERSYLETKLKHLPGQHDQGKHAPKGSATRAAADKRVERKRRGRERFLSQQEVEAAKLRELRGGDKSDYKQFEIWETAGNWFKQRQPEPTEEEEAALRQYEGTGYLAINRHLRGQDVDAESAAKAKEVVNVIDGYMARSPLPEPIFLYRGMQNKSIARAIDSGEDLSGMEFTDKGYVSSSVNSTKAGSFAGTGSQTIREDGEPFAKYAVEFELMAPAGTKAIMRVGPENEVILDRGTKFRVVGQRVEELEEWQPYREYPMRRLYVEVVQ